MAHFSRQAQARTVLFLILSTIIISFQNCGTQSNLTYEQSAAYSSHSIDLPPSDILSTATPKITLTEGVDAINTSLYTIKFQISGIELSQLKSIKCQLDNGVPQICTNQMFAVEVSTEGDHQIKVTVISQAGITSEVTKLFRKDTTGPTIHLVNKPKPISNETATLVTFVASDDLVGVDRIECSLDAAEYKTCASPHALFALRNGDHGLRIIAYDKLGNKSDISTVDWTVDLIAPALSLNQTPANPTNLPSATFDFSGGGVAQYECQLDSTAYAVCTAPKTYSGLSSGSHTFKVRGTSNTGNISEPITYTWAIDLSTPTIMFGQVPTNPTNSASANFTFSGTGVVSYECKLDAETFQSCTSPRNFSTLASGNHTFVVRGKNNVGTLSNPVTHSWTIDMSPVSISISQGPPALTNSPAAGFTFTSATAVRYECSLNNSAYVACASPYNLSNLPERTHVLKVRGYNNVETVSSVASHTWIVDTTKPTLPMPTINVTSPTNSNAVQFTFNSTDASGISLFRCSVNNEPETYCTSPFSYNTTQDGQYKFQVTATDNAGNVSASSSVPWTVDTKPPAAPTVTSDLVYEPSKSSSVNFSFTAIDPSGIANYRCFLDANIANSIGWNPCFSPRSISNLQNGQHTFDVYAVDKAGNVSEVKRITFSVQVKIYTAISLGGNHACGITSEKTVQCTGWNGSGQLGNNKVDEYESGLNTVDVVNLTNIKAISAGGSHTCALTETGLPKCWGSNAKGSLGNGTRNNSSVPVDVSGITGAKAISTGGEQSCVITSNNKVKCWGGNSLGEVGDGGTNSVLTPVEIPGLSDVTSIYSTLWYSCAITGGSLKCWGNLKGHLSAANNSSTPVDASDLVGLKSACLGTNHTCVIGADDKVKCWGENSKGQLGNGSFVDSSTAVNVSGLGRVKDISCFSNHTCAATNSGDVKCWGENSFSQLGDGTNINSKVPVDFRLDGIANQVGAGNSFSCALHDTGSVSCAGNLLGEW